MRRRILATFVLILGAFLTYLYFRVLGPLRPWPVLFWGFAAVLAGGQLAILWLPLVFWNSTDPEMKPHERVLEKIAHVAMGLSSLLLFLAVARDLAALALASAGRGDSLGGPATSLAILAATAGLGLAGYLVARAGPVLRRVVVGEARGGEPLRIVQISDLHVGSWIGRAYVEKVVARVLGAGPIDLLVLTGDIGDGDPKAHVEDLAPLGRIPAGVGKFAVTGNHEGYWNEREWNERVRALGFRILENESAEIATPRGRISIHGVSDFRADPKRALATVRSDVYSIFLAHQPKHAEAAIAAGARLQLSGHTHAGQFLPWSLFIGLFHRFAKGLYRVDRTSIYVNAGTGFWGPPFRLGTRSEATLIELFPG